MLPNILYSAFIPIGDAIYLNTNDFKFYTGNSNEIKSSGAIVCESPLYGLREANINVMENIRRIAFTKNGYLEQTSFLRTSF